MKPLWKFVLLTVLLAQGGLPLLNHDYMDDLSYIEDSPRSEMMEFAPRALDVTDTGELNVTSTGGSTDTTSESAALDAVSSPVDVSTLDELGSLAPSEGMINIDTNSELEHNRNFVKISQDLKAYEDAYKACLENISDSDFSMETIEKCVGVDYQFVYDDIDYEKRKILARADSTIRTDMISICYNEAGADLVMDNACDLLQKDALDLMWSELNFEILVEYHREKYVFIHAKLPDDLFTKVINRFKDVYRELAQLVEELYAHRDLTIARLKREIDERTTIISDKFRYQADHPTPKLKKDVITIDETLIDHPNYYVPLDNLPRPMIENGQDQAYALGGNPWTQSFAQNVGPDNYAAINSPYETPDFGSQPLIFSDWFRKRHLARVQKANGQVARGRQMRGRQVAAARQRPVMRRAALRPVPMRRARVVMRHQPFANKLPMNKQ